MAYSLYYTSTEPKGAQAITLWDLALNLMWSDIVVLTGGSGDNALCHVASSPQRKWAKFLQKSQAWHTVMACIRNIQSFTLCPVCEGACCYVRCDDGFSEQLATMVSRLVPVGLTCIPRWASMQVIPTSQVLVPLITPKRVFETAGPRLTHGRPDVCDIDHSQSA